MANYTRYVAGPSRATPAALWLRVVKWVVLVLVVDLGRPQNFWHPLVMWNPHSVMFEITWCIILYTTVLTLEFAPVVLEKFHLHAQIKVLRTISLPIVVAGVIL